MLFIFIACGKIKSDDLYLKIVNTTPKSSQSNASTYDQVIIDFNEKIMQVHMVLRDINKIAKKVEGTTQIINKRLTFTPEIALAYRKYQVTIYKSGTTSPSKKTLKKDYSYTFTIKAEVVIDPPMQKDEKE